MTTPTDGEWSVSEQIWLAAHRWPQIMLFGLVGGLVGLVIALVWPAPARATLELYVGLNIVAPADPAAGSAVETGTISAAVPLPITSANMNDYKNWQMANLNAMIFIDEIVAQTLERLRQEDGYWQNVNQEQLVGSLKAYWRNAGKWRLVVEHSDPQRASQAVVIWQDVVVEWVHQAVQASQDLSVLAGQMQAFSAAQAAATTRLEALVQVHTLFGDWLEATQGSPSDLPLVTTDHDWLQALALAADPGLTWEQVLGEFPAQGAPLAAYRLWVQRALPLLEQDTRLLQAQSQSLEAGLARLTAESSQASQQSLGLSANLEVQKINPSVQVLPEISKVRPVGLLMLIGTALGLVIWILIWIVRPELRS